MEGEDHWLWQWERVIKEICWSVALIVVGWLITLLLEKLWLRPRRSRSVLQKQGISGPKPSFPFGNISEMQRINQQPPPSVGASHSWVYSMFPYLQVWKQQYGSIYMYTTGIRQHLFVAEPKLIKELNLHRSLDLGKPSYLSNPLKPMLGAGLIRANGLQWAFQRNLIAPEFFLTKTKSMLGFMEEATVTTVKAWERRITQNEGRITEFVIDEDLKVLSADVISKACFGSSYAQGNQIFEKLATMQALLAKPSILFGFLNLSFLPTKENRKVWKLKKEVDTLIVKIINDREVENQKSGVHENPKDLLQLILEGAAATLDSGGKGTFKLKHKHEVDRLIIDMCKNMYFAGSETTTLGASWTLLLLALHPAWQQRVRSEIMETYDNVLPGSLLDMDKLGKLKALTMVIQESLRLYGPAITTTRETLAEMKLGELVLPKGINIWMFMPALHRDPENWGPDANEFKPERFAGGVSEACKYPQAYIPFGMGSRICLGRNFGLTEIKVILYLLLSKFSFSVSPNYRHCPVYNMLLLPKYGIRLLVSKVH